ncbi:MAG: hypothetical protein JXB15_01550 [Anaerolineales bacterium]|nr:hypothetical protein [Anaerolineales bacterium]
MNLKKSKKSALILSCIAVITYTLVSAFLNILLPYWISGDLRSIVAHPENLGRSTDIIALAAIIILALVALVSLAAYWLYQFFGEAYYGRKGAFRWALFGGLFGLLSQLAFWIVPDLTVVRVIWQFASAIIAFFIARIILPLEHRG